MSEPGKIGNLARVGAVVLCAVAAGLWWTKQDGSGDEGRSPKASPAKPSVREVAAGQGGAGAQQMTGAAPGISLPPRLIRSRSVTEGFVVEGEVSTLLASGGGLASEHVRRLQGLRGTELVIADRVRALEFLAGKDWPRELAKGDGHWLADELLTTLRMQEPPQEDLAARLAEVAFQPQTDPVVRDYIMQHLGHWWEQCGAQEEIEAALWRAVETADETTPGSALIALSRGYERDARVDPARKVRERALALAEDEMAPLASRVTALAIAGEEGDRPAKQYAVELLKNPKSPLMLKKVAENLLAR